MRGWLSIAHEFVSDERDMLATEYQAEYAISSDRPIMDDHDVINAAIARTGVERYRYLCFGHPDPKVRESYTRWILTGMPADIETLPPAWHVRLRSAFRAFFRWTRSGFAINPPSEQERRLAICQACANFRDGTCTLCGCVARFKKKLASEHCPIGKW